MTDPDIPADLQDDCCGEFGCMAAAHHEDCAEYHEDCVGPTEAR